MMDNKQCLCEVGGSKLPRYFVSAKVDDYKVLDRSGFRIHLGANAVN